jgi:hypothetical protein
MAIYRFRVTFEDQDDVYREIEIRANQTFEDLHYALLESIGFDSKHEASFYMSDDFWRKGQEITLNPKPVDDDDDVPRLKRKAPAKTMKQSKLAAFIEDPHQKIVYVYDFKANWILYLELVRIGSEDPKISYPKCVKSAGAAPKQYKLVNPPPAAALEEDDEAAAPLKEAIFTEVEAYEEEGETDEIFVEEAGGEEAEEAEEAEAEGEAEEEGGDMFGDAHEFGGGDDYEER